MINSHENSHTLSQRCKQRKRIQHRKKSTKFLLTPRIQSTNPWRRIPAKTNVFEMVGETVNSTSLECSDVRFVKFVSFRGCGKWNIKRRPVALFRPWSDSEIEFLVLASFLWNCFTSCWFNSWQFNPPILRDQFSLSGNSWTKTVESRSLWWWHSSNVVINNQMRVCSPAIDTNQ